LTSVNVIAALIGAVLSITIVFLTRRDHISPLVAARWFVLAILVLFVSFFPGLVDLFGKTLGIGYPPIIPIIIALGGAMIKILLMDIERQKMQVKLDRVVQRLAMLEGTLSENKVVLANFHQSEKKELKYIRKMDEK
jgi:hypothetical protein